MPAAVAFIEPEVAPEATVRVTVVFRGTSDTPIVFVATVKHAVSFLAYHSTRDMTSNEVYVVQGKAGLASFDLDQVSSIGLDAGNEEGRKQVLTLYEELTT